MSGFGKFSTIRYRFRPRRDAPSWIHRVSRSTPLSVPPPPPPSILRFSQGFTVMPRNKTRRPPLIRITPENPRNCTVARYYRARKNGIRARFRHSFTVFTLSIPPPRIFDPSIAPLLPSISIFPLRKSIIETWEISKLYISFVSPWRAVRFISKQLRTLHSQEGWNYYWNEFILFEFGESKCKCKCIRNFVRFALRGFVYYMNTRDVVESWFLRIFPFLGFIGRELTGASFSIESPELFSVLVSLNPRWQVDYDTTRRGYAFESNWGYCCRLFTPGWMHIHPAQAL